MGWPSSQERDKLPHAGPADHLRREVDPKAEPGFECGQQISFGTPDLEDPEPWTHIPP
jgi:hypothetical protein